MKGRIFFTVILIATFTSCDNLHDGTVGSNNDTQIPGMSFTVDTTYISGTVLYARGMVTNTRTTTVTTPWYVEGQFYTNDSYSTKLGGNNTRMNFPLERGKSTFWTITFSTSNVDVRQFPNFRVSDFRAIYKN